MKNSIPRTYGGYVSKRTNKRKAPYKHDMIFYLRDYKEIRYAMDCPYKTVKKAFAENDGFDWWNNKNKEIK